MTATDLALLSGALAAACVAAAIAARQLQQSRRDVRLLLCVGGAFVAATLLLCIA